MKIPLDKFEQIIDETILKRGLSYYKNGFVTDFTELSVGEYEAVVSGSEDYTVRLEVNHNEIVQHDCDCPYDFGAVCKHVVASIFYLIQDKLNSNEQNLPLVKKKKSIHKQVNELLDKVSHKDLKKFIQEHSKIDKQFRDLFFSSFADLNESQSKEFFQKQIQSVVNSATDRHGFIGWHEMKYLEQGIDPIISIAETHFENKNFKTAIHIYTALMEVMTETLQFCDDSNGFVGGIIDSSFETLSHIASQNISEDIRKDLFDYCIFAFNMKYYEGWNWHIDILHIAYKLETSEEEAEIIIKCLDKIKGNYEIESAQYLKLEILKNYKDKTEVQKFIDEHINNTSIRRAEIEKAVKHNDFEKAIKLCKDGITYDKNKRPGLVKDWYNWLLKIAQTQNNSAEIIEYARYLFIDNFRPEQDYYQILKKEINSNKWESFLEEIIKEITPKGNWKYNSLVREIYINEKWWDKLYALVQQNTSLENIENNEKYLSKEYSAELIQLYSERIVKYIDRYMGRNHYQKACRYLRRMQKLGGKEEVNKLIKHFREKYPKRKALLDELNQV